MFHQYLNFIVSDRDALYQDQQPPPIDINSIQNGMFLNKLIHSRFGLAQSAFLKVCQTIILAIVSRYEAAAFRRLPTLPSIVLMFQESKMARCQPIV